MRLYAPCVHRCLWVPKEGIGYPRARVIDDCEPPMWIPGTVLRFLYKNSKAVVSSKPVLQPLSLFFSDKLYNRVLSFQQSSCVFLSSTEVTDEFCNTHVLGVGVGISELWAEPCWAEGSGQGRTRSFPHLSFSGQTRAVSLKTVGQVSSISLAYDSYGCRTGRVAANLL